MLLAASAAFVLAASTSVATAASAPQTLVPDAAGPYCAIDLSDQKKACFTTERGLTAYSSTLESVPLVGVYNWINYSTSGGYSIWYGSHACTATTGDGEYGISDLTGYKYTNNPGTSHNNTYSSVSTFVAQGCDIKLFDGTNYSGASSPWIDRCTNLGGSGTGDCPSTNWYDRASSFQLS